MNDPNNPAPAPAAGVAAAFKVTGGHATAELLRARLESAEGRGWVRLNELLRAAAADPVVSESRPAADFAALACELAGDAITARSCDEALQPLVSALAALRAKRKHAGTEAARDWVLSEWATHATGYDRNKTAFAADYAPRCKRERGVDVRERTIRETWLRGR